MDDIDDNHDAMEGAKEQHILEMHGAFADQHIRESSALKLLKGISLTDKRVLGLMNMVERVAYSLQDFYCKSQECKAQKVIRNSKELLALVFQPCVELLSDPWRSKKFLNYFTSMPHSSSGELELCAMELVAVSCVVVTAKIHCNYEKMRFTHIAALLTGGEETVLAGALKRTERLVLQCRGWISPMTSGTWGGFEPSRPMPEIIHSSESLANSFETPKVSKLPSADLCLSVRDDFDHNGVIFHPVLVFEEFSVVPL